MRAKICLGLLMAALAMPANATMTTTTTSDPTALAIAMLGSLPVTIVGTPNFSSDGAQAGSFTDDSQSPVFFSNGIFLTTGVASCITAPNSSTVCSGAGTETELWVNFTPAEGVGSLKFNLMWASDEPLNRASSSESLLLSLNGTNYAHTSDGKPFQADKIIASPDYVPNVASPTGYDWFTTPLQFSAPVTPGVTNSLHIRIRDGGDDQYDSAVFIQSAGFSYQVPEPGTICLMAGGLLALAGYKLRKK